MKNILRTVVMVLTMAVAVPTVVAADYGYTEKEVKANKKAAAKQAKSMAKTLKKQKWVYGGAIPLESALENFLLNTEFSNGMYRESTQTIVDAPNIKRGESLARSGAENDLVREIQIAIRGEINEQVGNAGGGFSDVQVDTFTKKVANELNGEVKKYFTVYRQNAKGTYEVRVYFAVPDVAGSGAFKRQVRENTDFSRMVRDYINEGENTPNKD